MKNTWFYLIKLNSSDFSKFRLEILKAYKNVREILHLKFVVTFDGLQDSY